MWRLRRDGGKVGVRDSKNPTGQALVFTPTEWDAFTAGIQNGEFNCPSQQTRSHSLTRRFNCRGAHQDEAASQGSRVIHWQ
ncbi:DUF397 domain-containing protein [Nocardia sp. NPDC050408]|uniref:DUF397 domain-containing protein n=1 Tax=Nocardia sp. NPDC050408 TaxID=3364319 RepID=UPI0037B6E111